MFEDWKPGSVEVLVEIKNALKNCRWYLEGGTLLGAVRSGTLIPWRACLNIGALGNHKKVYRALEKIGFEINIHCAPIRPLAVATRHDAYVDVVLGTKVKAGWIFYTVFHKVLMPKRFFEKLDTVTLDGIEFPAPAFKEEYLTSTYGNWKKDDHRHIVCPPHERFAVETIPVHDEVYEMVYRRPGWVFTGSDPMLLQSFGTRNCPEGAWHD